MKNYVVVIGAPILRSGTLRLTESQYINRSYCLKKLGDDLYEIVHPVQFKTGEKIGYDGPVSKSVHNELVEIVDIAEEKVTQKNKKESKKDDA